MHTVVPDLDRLAGTERAQYAICAALASRGNRVTAGLGPGAENLERWQRLAGQRLAGQRLAGQRLGGQPSSLAHPGSSARHRARRRALTVLAASVRDGLRLRHAPPDAVYVHHGGYPEALIYGVVVSRLARSALVCHMHIPYGRYPRLPGPLMRLACSPFDAFIAISQPSLAEWTGNGSRRTG
ncbi:MAG: hypothetical protein ACYDH5_15220 [Acidimicrobiales bacterium]